MELTLIEQKQIIEELKVSEGDLNMFELSDRNKEGIIDLFFIKPHEIEEYNKFKEEYKKKMKKIRTQNDK